MAKSCYLVEGFRQAFHLKLNLPIHQLVKDMVGNVWSIKGNNKMTLVNSVLVPNMTFWAGKVSVTFKSFKHHKRSALETRVLQVANGEVFPAALLKSGSACTTVWSFQAPQGYPHTVFI